MSKYFSRDTKKRTGSLMTAIVFAIVNILTSTSVIFMSSNVVNVHAVSDVSLNVNWPVFMNENSPTWENFTDKPLDAPMIGNGLLGTYMIQDPTSGQIRFEMSREDLTDVRINYTKRKTNGYFKFAFADTPTGTSELDLWNAQIKSNISVGNNKATLRAFAAASPNVIVFELMKDPSLNYYFDFVPDNRGWAGTSEPAGGYVAYPTPTVETYENCQVSTQTMPVSSSYNTQNETAASQHATAWRVVDSGISGITYIYTSVGYSYRASTAKQDAVNSINSAVSSGFSTFF